MITHFDQLSAMTALLTNDELHALADKCQNLIADRERVEREELRQKLIENLQRAIDDVLLNGFNLMIENVNDANWAVQLFPDDNYNIEIK